jgi:hypothetical protein
MACRRRRRMLRKTDLNLVMYFGAMYIFGNQLTDGSDLARIDCGVGLWNSMSKVLQRKLKPDSGDGFKMVVRATVPVP